MLKKIKKVRHTKHGEGIVVRRSDRYIYVKYERYKRPIRQNIRQIGVNIEILRDIQIENKVQKDNQQNDLTNQNEVNALKRGGESIKKDSRQEKKDDVLTDSEIKRELKRLRRQLMSRNHKYELEGFVCEETILRRIKELENLLLSNEK